MTTLQILAAGMAGVDRVVFHTGDPSGAAPIAEAKRLARGEPGRRAGAGRRRADPAHPRGRACVGHERRQLTKGPAMAISNHDRVGKAMELLKGGLGPFVDREFKGIFKDRAAAEVLRYLGDDRLNAKKPIAEKDVAALLKLMWDAWNEVFRITLGPAERSLVSELRDHRNRWAHQETFSGDDAYRALDSAGRLLSAVSAPQADDIEKMKTELLRLRFDEQARSEKRKSAGTAIEAAASGGLKPWREVVTPHKDVASGRYQQAEFAADLWQVHLGEGTDEYRDPAEFFRRTYLTESLKGMLVGAVRRLSGEGGDPVVQLQTNFGGGKTHSMLALYHLFSGTAPTELVGIDAVMQEADAKTLPTAKSRGAGWQQDLPRQPDHQARRDGGPHPLGRARLAARRPEGLRPHARGVTCCENTVAKLMKAEGVRPKARRPFVVRTTDSRHGHPVAANTLNREFYPDRPDTVWTADITYVPTAQGWLYLAVVLDLCSRRVVGWATADHLRSELACDALRMALKHRRPTGEPLHHSDRGVQYASGVYQDLLTRSGIEPSMSRTGNSWDDAVTESFFSTVKRELTHHESYATREDARRSLFEYIEVFYNRQRFHHTLGYRSPAEYEVRFAS